MTSPRQRDRRIALGNRASASEIQAGRSPEEAALRDFWVDSVCNMLNRRCGGVDPTAATVGQYKAKWDGGVSSGTGRTHQPVWPKLLALKDVGINPYLLMEMFLETWPGAGVPCPLDLLSESLHQKYFMQPSPEDTLRRTLRVQTDYADIQRTAMLSNPAYQTQDQVWRALVANRRSVLTPLFRFCLAVQTGITDLQAQLLPAAALEYMLRREAYDKIWGQHIAPVLREATPEQLAQYRKLQGSV